MAPEVYRGDDYGAGADIYSLGVVLYSFLNNNRVPFLPEYPKQITFSDREEALSRRMNGEAIPVPKNCSPALAEIILKACSFYMSERFSNASEMKYALQRYSGEDVPDTELFDEKTVLDVSDIYDGSTVLDTPSEKSIRRSGGSHLKEEKKEKKKKNNRALLITAAALAVIALSVEGWLLFRESTPAIPAETPVTVTAEPTPESAPTPEATPTPPPEPTPMPEPTPTHINASGLAEMGSCGDNAKWELFNDGTLYIDGSGEMGTLVWDKEAKEYVPPWNNHLDIISEVIFSNNITVIGERAFADCVNLKKVTLPAGLTAIKASAFKNTPWQDNNTSEFVVVGNGILIKYNGIAQTVTIPDDVVYISDVFRDSSASSIVIPDSVTTIGDYAFYNCKCLLNVTLSKNVKTIGDYAFAGCSRLVTIKYGTSGWNSIKFGKEALKDVTATVTIGGMNKQGTMRSFELVPGIYKYDYN